MNKIVTFALVILFIVSVFFWSNRNSELVGESVSSTSSALPEVVTQNSNILSKEIQNKVISGESSLSVKTELPVVPSVLGPINAIKQKRGSPLDDYNDRLQDALEGDANAQFSLSSILRRCKFGKKPSPDYFDTIETSIYIPKEELDQIKENVEECDSLYAAVDGKDLLELANAWQAEAAEQENEYAIFGQYLHQNAPLAKGDWPALTKAMFEKSGNSPELLSKALQSMLIYNVDQTDTSHLYDVEYPDSSAFRVSVDTGAWELIYCEFSDACGDRNLIWDRFNTLYDLNEVNARVERARELTAFISEGEWGKLNLPEHNNSQ